VAKALTDMLRRRMLKKQIIKPVTFEELVVTTGGYGVSQIEISKDSPILGTTILDSNLRSRDITVLAVQRGAEVMPNPSPNTELLLNDKLICFGKLDSIRHHLCPTPAQ
jgi:ribosomal protein S6--L-glutamate ligase